MRDFSAQALDTDFAALSPMREWAAYEALWDQPQASAKSIADQCRKQAFSPLSDWVSVTMIDKFINQLQTYVNKSTFFDVCFNGIIEFPKKLRDATNSTPFLYYKGDWDLIFSRSIAVVGTRKPTPEGIQRTRKLVKALVGSGYTIISGLAEGIDTVAHNTALECGGRTIAVIGTPITEYYPKSNQSLQDEIAKNHLLISQVPFLRYLKQDFRLNRLFFPERNKTMSAISLATVIVEAGQISGTLIQAREALHQKRKLFILASCFENKNLSWPETYEKKGAIRTKEFNDILTALEHFLGSSVN